MPISSYFPILSLCILIFCSCFILSMCRKAKKAKKAGYISADEINPAFENTTQDEAAESIEAAKSSHTGKIVFNGLGVLLGAAVLLWGYFAHYDFWGNDFSWDIWPPQTAPDFHSLFCILLSIPFLLKVFFYGISVSSKVGRKEGSRHYTVRENAFGGLTASNAGNASLGGCLGAIVGFIVSIVLFVSFVQLALLIFTVIRLARVIIGIRALKNISKQG